MSDIAALLRYRDKARSQYEKAIRCSRMGRYEARGEELDRLAAQEATYRRRYAEAQRAVNAALKAAESPSEGASTP